MLDGIELTSEANPFNAMSKQAIIQLERIQREILLLRGQRVMLGQHLAELYGVPVKALNQAVRRNLARFPEDFMFQLSQAEFNNLKSQFVTSSWGGIRRASPSGMVIGAAMRRFSWADALDGCVWRNWAGW